MPQQVRVCFLPSELEAEPAFPTCVVVIDLLRASTTICHALANGAVEVIPVETPAQAQELRQSMGREKVLLCGERVGVKIEGFDLGNSPSEYTHDTVAGKKLIFCSSNGSGALLAARGAHRLAMAGLVNARLVLNWLASEPGDVCLVCSGKLGAFCAEDAACAGYLAAKLLGQGYTPGNDAVRTALLLAAHANRGWHAFLEGTDHGQYLKGLGFGPDLSVAAAVDSVNVVPEWSADRLVRAREKVGA